MEYGIHLGQTFGETIGEMCLKCLFREEDPVKLAQHVQIHMLADGEEMT